MRIRKFNDDLKNDEILFISKVSDALAHPARLRMFRYIMHCNQAMEKVCNKDLVAEFDYAQATVSQHMEKLIIAGLIETKKENRFTYYYAHLGNLLKYVDSAKKFSII